MVRVVRQARLCQRSQRLALKQQGIKFQNFTLNTQSLLSFILFRVIHIRQLSILQLIDVKISDESGGVFGLTSQNFGPGSRHRLNVYLHIIAWVHASLQPLKNESEFMSYKLLYPLGSNGSTAHLLTELTVYFGLRTCHLYTVRWECDTLLLVCVCRMALEQIVFVLFREPQT